MWVEDEEEAKEWLATFSSESREGPVTPTSRRRGVVGNEETPWTMAKRKAVSRQVSDQSENGSGSGEAGPSEEKEAEKEKKKLDDGFVFVDADDEGDESPSRRAAKRARVDGIGNAFAERLREVVVLPPTPPTLEKGKGKEKEKAADVVPIPLNYGPPIPGTSRNPLHLGELENNGDLTARVLQLLRKEKIQLKESTVEKLRLEIDLELRSNAAREQIYEEAVARLSKRLDGLENIASNWMGMDDPIELSD